LPKFDLYIPTYGAQVENKDRFSKHNFQYDEEKDEYTCPEGKPVIWTTRTKDKRYGFVETYTCRDCTSCPYRQACFKNKKDFRTITALPHDKLINQIKEKMQTPEGKLIYKLRKQTVEIAFADIKYNKKLIEFLTRGVERVKTEFNLVCSASNLIKINNLIKKKKTKTGEFLATAC
jgi:transposase